MELVQAVEAIRELAVAYRSWARSPDKPMPPVWSDMAWLAEATQHLGEAVLKTLSAPPTVTITEPEAIDIPPALWGGGVVEYFTALAKVWTKHPPDQREAEALLALLALANVVVTGPDGYTIDADSPGPGVKIEPEPAAGQQKEVAADAEYWVRAANYGYLGPFRIIGDSVDFWEGRKWERSSNNTVEKIRGTCVPVATEELAIRFYASTVTKFAPESRVMRSSPGEEWWITPKGDRHTTIWHVSAGGKVTECYVNGAAVGNVVLASRSHLDSRIGQDTAQPIDELEARVLIHEAQAKWPKRELEQCRAALSATKANRAGDTEAREKAEADATELRTKLELAQANETELEAKVGQLQDWRGRLNSRLTAANNALAAQRAKEAERVAAIEQGIKDIVRGYWCKMSTAMDFMREYARKGRWARLKTPFPYLDVAHIVAWDATTEADDGLFKHQDRAIAGAFRQANMPAADPEPDEPGKQPAVHPV